MRERERERERERGRDLYIHSVVTPGMLEIYVRGSLYHPIPLGFLSSQKSMPPWGDACSFVDVFCWLCVRT